MLFVVGLFESSNPSLSVSGSSSVVGSSISVLSSSSQSGPPLLEANVPPLLGVAPLGPCPLTKEQTVYYSMLEAAFYHMPHPSDSDRARLYLPRSPAHTPLYYPQV